MTAADPKIAVIGAGKWGRNHVKTLCKLGVLYAATDASPGIRAELSKEYPEITVYRDHSQLLADPFIDGVVIATPAFTHNALTREALLAGKDVLVEKPMTMNLTEADELIGLAASHNRILMTGHLLMFSPAVSEIKKIIEKGKIGELIHLELRRLKLGRVRSEENVLWSFAPHDLAVMLYLMDSEVKTIKAAGINALQSAIADDVHLHLNFESGAAAHIHASWIWPETERKIVIAGTKGMIIYDQLKNEAYLYEKYINRDLEICDNGFSEITFHKTVPLLDLEDGHFIECVKTRAAPLTDGPKSRKVMEILTLADTELQKIKH